MIKRWIQDRRGWGGVNHMYPLGKPEGNALGIPRSVLVGDTGPGE